MLHADLTEVIIGCAYDVHNDLGCGFLEKVYENALAYLLRQSGYEVEQQKKILVRFRKVVVGDYQADLIVESKVLIELKAASGIDPEHVAQCLNYLKATGIPVALILNFGKPKLEFKRLVF